MYLRFVSPLKHGGSEKPRDLHMGIFHAAGICRDDVEMPAWLHRHLVEEMRWFNEYLPCPADRYFDRAYVGHLHPDAICWFKTGAKRFIDRAWTLKALIEEAGLPLTVVHTRQPGSISYQDKYQIVAHPLRADLPKFG